MSCCSWVQPQLYADNLICVSRDPDLLLNAARFTTGYVRLVGQEVAPSKCVFLITSREVRKDMKEWVLSQKGEKGSVKLDVRDLGGHLDTTFRGWSATLAAGVRLVISRLVLIFALPLDSHGRVRVVRSMYLPAALHGIEASLLASVAKASLLFPQCGWYGLVDSPWLVLVLSLACWMGPLGVTLHFASSGFGSVCFVGILLFGLRKFVGSTVCLRWWVRVVLGTVLSIFFPLVLLRLGFGGILSGWVGLDLGCLCLVI